MDLQGYDPGPNSAVVIFFDLRFPAFQAEKTWKGSHTPERQERFAVTRLHQHEVQRI